MRTDTTPCIPVVCGALTLSIAAVHADVDVALYLVALPEPSATDTTEDLPKHVEKFEVCETFILELWVSDVGALNTGIIAAYFDLAFDPLVVQADALHHSDLYTLFPEGAIDSIKGIVINFGGVDGTFTGFGVEPEWARLGYVELTGVGEGQTTVTASLGLGGIGVLGRPPPSTREIDFGSATISIVPCPGDLDCDGSVGAADLLALLFDWGPCKGCAADFDDDGVVGASDLLTLLANWGPCP